MKRFQFALRTLLKAPEVTGIAIISLALGIGATTAIFSIFNQIILRPLPVRDPARLVNLSSPGPKPGSHSCNDAGNCDSVFSYPMFRDLEKAQTAFTEIAAHRLFRANLAYRGQTMSGDGMLVSGSYFPALGLQPVLGRLLGPSDDQTIGEPHVAVLGHAYWRTHCQASPAVLNETLIVNGQALTIVGVAPEGFDGTTLGSQPQVYVPITLREALLLFRQPKGFEERRNYWAYLFARLKPGVSIERAGAALDIPYKTILNDVEAPLQKELTEQQMTAFKARRVQLEEGQAGQSTIHREARAPLLLLLLVTAVVLLIACANVANLLLARSAARTGEMAVRLSIGASRGNLISQLLTESCTLSILGGLSGLAVARWTVAVIMSMLPSDEPGLILKFDLDPRVLFFAAVVTIGTGILFGLFPALHSTRADVLSALKGQAGQPSGARAAARFRSGLATVQIGMSMMLLVSAGLFTKSLFKIGRVDLGLKVDNVITFGLSPGLSGYKPAQSRALFDRLETELAAQPGVRGVTSAMVPMLTGSNWGNGVSVQGRTARPGDDSGSLYNEVGPGYFRSMGISLLAGREFTASDVVGAPKVAIVNEQFAKEFHLGPDAVGKRMKPGDDHVAEKDLDVQIVGLVRNTKYSDVKQKMPALFYLPHRQNEGIGNMTFYVRGAMEPENLLSIVRPVVAQLDRNLPVENLRTMEATIRDNLVADRVTSILSAAFASLATVLAAVGLYGVLAYTVAQRTREFGLRMALGATPDILRRMVFRQVGLMTVIGGVVGLAAAIGLGELAQSLLFEIKGWDSTVLGVSAILLVLVAFGAGFIPANRASNVDPMKALRYE